MLLSESVKSNVYINRNCVCSLFETNLDTVILRLDLTNTELIDIVPYLINIAITVWIIINNLLLAAKKCGLVTVHKLAPNSLLFTINILHLSGRHSMYSCLWKCV